MKPDATMPAIPTTPTNPLTTTQAIAAVTNLTQAQHSGDEFELFERAPFLVDLEAALSGPHADNVNNADNVMTHSPTPTPPVPAPTLSERIDTFWQWFLANEAALYGIRLNADGFIDEAHMDQIIELGEACGKIDNDLSVEIENSGSEGMRGLVISANGIAEVFPVVEAIVDAAPQLDRWRVIRYRQRQETISPLHLKGRTIKPEEVKFGIARNTGTGEFGVYIFMPGYNELDRQSFHHMGFIFLDLCLGEFDVATKITSVDFHDIHALPKIERVSLKEFPRVFDFIFAKSRH